MFSLYSFYSAFLHQIIDFLFFLAHYFICYVERRVQQTLVFYENFNRYLRENPDKNSF